MDEIKSTLGLILSLQKDMKKDIGKLDQKIDNVEKRLNERIDKVEINLKKVEENLNEKIDHRIERVRVENMIYYMNFSYILFFNFKI